MNENLSAGISLTVFFILYYTFIFYFDMRTQLFSPIGLLIFYLSTFSAYVTYKVLINKSLKWLTVIKRLEIIYFTLGFLVFALYATVIIYVFEITEGTIIGYVFISGGSIVFPLGTWAIYSFFNSLLLNKKYILEGYKLWAIICLPTQSCQDTRYYIFESKSKEDLKRYIKGYKEIYKDLTDDQVNYAFECVVTKRINRQGNGTKLIAVLPLKKVAKSNE